MHFISKELTPGLIGMYALPPPPPYTHTHQHTDKDKDFHDYEIFFFACEDYLESDLPTFKNNATVFVLLLLYGLLAFFSPNIARYKNEDYIFGHCFRSFIIIDWNYRTPKEKIWIKITKSFIFKHIKNNFFL